MPERDFTQTPEFKSAVDAAVAKAADSLMARLQTARVEAGTSQADSDGDVVNRLAIAIAQLTDQGVGRYQRKVDPALLAQRQSAHERMIDLILAAHAKGHVPHYALRHKVFLPMGGVGEQLVEPMYIGTDKNSYQRVISWPGVPNEAMIPEDDLADGIFTAFREWIGTEKTGAPDPLSKVLAISPNGNVVEGEAAALIMRQGKAGREVRDVDANAGPVGGMVGNSQQKLVRVLGTIHSGAMENSNNIPMVRR